MFTKEQLAEILAVCDKATEGPWEAIDIPGDVTFVYAKRPILVSDENICIDCSLSDADFIALARTALPQLAEDYRKLLVVAEAAKELAKELNLRTEVNVVSGIGNHDITIRVNLGDTRFWQSADNFNQALIDAGYGGEG